MDTILEDKSGSKRRQPKDGKRGDVYRRDNLEMRERVRELSGKTDALQKVVRRERRRGGRGVGCLVE